MCKCPGCPLKVWGTRRHRSSRRPALLFAAGAAGEGRGAGLEIRQVSFFHWFLLLLLAVIRSAAYARDFQICILPVVVVLGIRIQVVHRMLMVL